MNDLIKIAGLYHKLNTAHITIEELDRQIIILKAEVKRLKKENMEFKSLTYS